MGTYYRLVFVQYADRAADTAVTAVEDIRAIEALASTYRSESEISQLSNSPPGSARVLSPEIFAVLERSLYYYQLTDGAFDVTVGPLMNLWRAAVKRDKLPTTDEISKALQSVSSKNITLDPSARTIAFSRAGMSITLDAIVKGYAADLALAAIRNKGAQAALVDLGGDIVCFGHPPSRDGWDIGIQNPFQPASVPMDISPGAILATIRLTDAAVATSGNYQRTLPIQGESYSQIIDPRTGLPVHQAPSVTVIAPTAADADALATACSVLSVPEALDLINKIPNTEALLITGPAESPTFHTSSGFEKYLLTSLPVNNVFPAADRP
ncbi:MAG: hypothetical protein GWP14_05530 [Actinobacteria bacterium]|nr:hypothetical protein [Actinomycetota bacterium]